MPSFAATLPVLASILALTSAAELALTPVAPILKTPPLYAPIGPIGQRPGYTPGPQSPAVFKLTQVPAKPTGTPTQVDKCSQVAARITPQLTPKPTYPPSLKLMADSFGGIDQDTCGDMDFKAKFKSVNSADLNRFTQARYSTFIVPIWAKVHQLWTACGDEIRKMESVAQDPCYRWALELSKSANGSASKKNGGNNGGFVTGDKSKNGQGGNIKTPELEAVAAKSGLSPTVVVGLLGVMPLLWAILA